VKNYGTGSGRARKKFQKVVTSKGENYFLKVPKLSKIWLILGTLIQH